MNSPCDGCEKSPCSYVSATYCEKLKGWAEDNLKMNIMTKGIITKIERIGTHVHVTVVLSDPNNGLGYLDLNDPDLETKRAAQQEIYKKRVKEQTLFVGDVELLQ